jgi:hypothetical protein
VEEPPPTGSTVIRDPRPAEPLAQLVRRVEDLHRAEPLAAAQLSLDGRRDGAGELPLPIGHGRHRRGRVVLAGPRAVVGHLLGEQGVEGRVAHPR